MLTKNRRALEVIEAAATLPVMLLILVALVNLGFAVYARQAVQNAAAYAIDDSFGVVRESDLDGHLPAEGPPGTEAPPSPDAGAQTPGAQPSGADAGSSATHLGVTRAVPDDPTGGPDLALSIAYQLVRGVLVKR